MSSLQFLQQTGDPDEIRDRRRSRLLHHTCARCAFTGHSLVPR
jgi:hypothetical protein